MENVTPVVYDTLKRSNTNRIIDLCSGSGGPLVDIQRELLQKHKLETHITFTDLYPNQEQVQKYSNSQSLTYCAKSIDATNSPGLGDGLLTMFACFHHFTPQLGVKILQNAVTNGHPICIVEMQRRSIFAILICLINVIGVPLFFTPLLIPWNSLLRLLFTYVIPIIPVVVSFDGVMSCIRTYEPEELQQLISQVKGHETYTWTTKAQNFPLPMVTCVGIPKREK